MKDKKTLITIIVLLVIFLPIGLFGTIKSFSTTKSDVKDDNPNKEFKYNNKLYFYYNDKLLSTYECSTCTLATSSIDDINYHTNYYKSDDKELAGVLNEYYGLFKENDNIILYNLVNNKKIDSYKSIKNYNIEATSKFAITEKSSGKGVIFFDLSNSPIPNIYEYITLPSHIIDNKLDTSKFIVKKDNGNISKNSFFDYNTIPFMLNLGFEKFDITYISDKGTRNRVEQESKNIINILESDIDINSFLEYLPTIESDEYSYEEVLCILQIVINHFQVELLETVNLISDKDNFKNYRNLIKQEFNNYLNIVTVLQQYYNDEEKKYNDKFDKIDEKEEKNHIFYAFRNEDKSYLEYDLESLNPHYLEKVNRLINRLKLGELSRGEVKGLKSNNILKKQLELRDDQVRVIFYPLTDNNYIIVGVLTKKKDNDNDGYSKMAFRNKEIDISTPEKYIKEQEKSKLAEERFLKFIEDNKRKGTSR